MEALRTRKPVMISGTLLFDQRFWGRVCEERGVGPKAEHIRDLHRTCVAYIDEALVENGRWAMGEVWVYGGVTMKGGWGQCACGENHAWWVVGVGAA